MTLADRLKKARSYAELTQEGLAERSGVKQQVISKIESGRQQTTSFAVELAVACGVRPQWLSSGQGPMLEGDEDSSSLKDEYEFIPRYDVLAAAGAGAENHHEIIDKHLAFRRDWLVEKGLRAKDLKIIVAKGDSMEPRISSGDILLVDTSDRLQIQDSRIYALNIGGMTRVKRLSIRYDGALVIRSDNLASAPPHEEVVPKEEAAALALNIIGRVVWVGGDL